MANSQHLEDFKNSNGEWVWYVGNGKGRKYTKSGKLWWAMEARCKKGGSHQCRNPTYLDVENHFTSFQDFAGWCQDQVGYENSPDIFLDKDLLSRENKVYSPDTCLFLPKELNMFPVKCDGIRGLWPVGVNFNKRTQKFRAECEPSTSGFKRHIGYFNTPTEAFSAYKSRKEQIAKILAEKWQHKIDNRAYLALKNFTVNITD